MRATPTEPVLKLERILVPVDFSKAAQEALDYAITMASKFTARITLIHVVEVISGPQDPTYGYVPVDTAASVAASARRLHEIAAAKIPAALLDTTLVRHGIPYYQITIAAKKLNMDLIIITTHGYTGLAHVFIGSTAERIVRHSPCPVLTVRRGASDAPAARGTKGRSETKAAL